MIYFYEQPDPRMLATAVAGVYSISPEEIGVVVNDRPVPGSVERPMVLITANPESEAESTVLETGDRFSAATGVRSVRELAIDLCRAIGSNAVYGEDSLPPDHWILVTSSGDHGEVAVDPDASDEGRIVIVGVAHPVDGAPDVPVF
ncbi:hypothetical protein AB0A73_09605 [Glycomyces sp. NPDC047369]